MKAQKKYSKRSLVSNLTVGISILLLGSVANSYTGKEMKSKFCFSMECRNLNPTDEIENAMQATAANIHLWSGNRSYKSILKAIIISASENRIEKIVEINHHLLATSLDVGNFRMARESASIINRFAPESMARLNQASLLSDGTPALTLFQRLNSRSKFSDRELDLINHNFRMKDNEYLIGNDSFNSEDSELSGEESIVDSIYNLTNDGTGEIFFYANKAGNRTNTLFAKLRDKMSQLSYKKSDCRLRYVAQIQEAVVVGASAGGSMGGAAGAYFGAGVLSVPGSVVGGVAGVIVGGAVHGYITSNKEKVELEKCNDGAEDSEKKTSAEPATSNEQQNKEQQSDKDDDEDEGDREKSPQERTMVSESPNADLQDTGTSATELVDLLSDYYNQINIRQIENYNSSALTVEEIQIKISSIVNFGNKESETSGVSAAELAQRAIQEQEKWTTPTKPLKQSIH